MSARKSSRYAADDADELNAGDDFIDAASAAAAAAEAEQAEAEEDEALADEAASASPSPYVPRESQLTAEELGFDNEDGNGEDGEANNVRVIVRVRPLLETEVASAHSCSLIRINDQRVQTSMPPALRDEEDIVRSEGSSDFGAGSISVGVTRDGAESVHRFNFDAVLTPNHTQMDVYRAGKVERMLLALLKGYNGTIFAYGQTGSGKTHSMDGISYSSKQVAVGAAPTDGSDQVQKMKTVRVLKEPSALESGLSLRCINELFTLIGAKQSAPENNPSPELQRTRYTVKCSFIQIYQESVFDLLSETVPQYVSRENNAFGTKVNSKSKGGSAAAGSTGLKIRWNPQKEFYVENLYIFECRNAKEARNYFLNGMKKRLVASHKMNASSSRSHCIFTLYLEKRSSDQAASDVTTSKLSLVDLAGSERAALTGATGEVLSQSIGINKSLFVLRKVIKALSQLPPTATFKAQKALAHVPYRDSTLTRLLKHSLGGNCHTLMVACINPSDAYSDENLSTLNYAGLTKKINNDARINEDPKTALIRKLRAEIKLLRNLLSRAKQSVILGSNASLNSGGTGGGSHSQLCANCSHRITDGRTGYSDTASTMSMISTPGGHSSSSSSMVSRPLSSSGSSRGLLLGPDSDLAEKLIDAVNHMKELVADNNDLRSLYDTTSTDFESLEFQNVTLQQENDELRDRVHFLETVIVEGQGEDILQSPDQLTFDEDGVEIPLDSKAPHAQRSSAETAFELAELRQENQRLKDVASEWAKKASNTNSSANNNGMYTEQPVRTARQSSAGSSSLHYLPSSQYSSNQSGQMTQRTSSAQAAINAVLSNSSITRPNAHVSAVYRTGSNAIQTLGALQGRRGRTGSKAPPQRSSGGSGGSSRPLTGSMQREWEKDRESELERERHLDREEWNSSLPSSVTAAWETRPTAAASSTAAPFSAAYYASRPNPAAAVQSRSNVPNLAQAAAMHPTIAQYMMQQQQQPQMRMPMNSSYQASTGSMNQMNFVQHRRY